ncbi:hypothetical protein LguiB_032068 [Lonicera macranthoides]
MAKSGGIKGSLGSFSTELGYIAGLPLYWHFIEGLANVSYSSFCLACKCDCSSQPFIFIPQGCNQRNLFRHMFKNVNKNFKGKHLKELCWVTASAFRLLDYTRAIDELDKATSGAKKYLVNEQGIMPMP